MTSLNETIDAEIEKQDRLLLAAEDWAKSYANNPDIHAKLIKQEAKIGRLLRKYLRTLASERLDNYINWQLYATQTVKAYKFNVVVDVEEIDSEEGDELMQVIHDPLQTALALGGQAAEQSYNIDLGLNEYHQAIQKATGKYVGDLVKGVTQTTKDRIQQSIAASIRLGEDREAARARMMKIVGDPRRADTITRTETVRAYNKGITTFGQESGATGKVWELSSDPCEICQGNDTGGDPIAFDDSFDSGDDEPPAHPNCRCGMSLVHSYDDGSTSTDEVDSGE